MRSWRGLAVAVGSALAVFPGAAQGAQPMTTDTSLLRVAFASPTRGVGLFQRLRGPTSGRGPESCLLYTRPTNNAGTSFGPRGATLARTNCESGLAVTGITFDRSGDLFAYGPRLEVSHNRGRTWTSPTLRGSIAGLAVGGRSAWALVTHCHPGELNCTLTLYESAGGSSGWRAAGEQPPDRTVPGPAALNGEAGTSTLLDATPGGEVVLGMPS
jgi:hypothetical protein